MDLKKTLIKFGICFLIGFVLSLAVWGMFNESVAPAVKWILGIVVFLLLAAGIYWIALDFVKIKLDGTPAIVLTAVISVILSFLIVLLCLCTGKWASVTFFGLLPLTIVNAILLFIAGGKFKSVRR